MLKQNKQTLAILIAAALMPAQVIAQPTPAQVVDGRAEISVTTQATPASPVTTTAPTLPPTDAVAPFKYKIVQPSKVDQVISKFGADVDMTEENRGSLMLFGLIAPECAPFLRVNAKDYMESQNLHPIAIEIAATEEAFKACTKENLQKAINEQSAIDLASFDHTALPNLVVGKSKLEHSGHVKLVGPSKCSAGAEDKDCFEAAAINGISGEFRTAEDEELADKRKAKEEEQKEISGLCAEAMKGSRPALESLQKLLGPKFARELAKIEKENVVPKELENLEERATENAAAPAYKALIKDISKYAKANKKNDEIKERLKQILAKIEGRARGLLSLGEKDLLAKDARRKEVRVAALEGILEIDPQNQEVSEALASIPLEEAVEACGAYAQSISKSADVLKSQNMKIQLAANKQLNQSAKQCQQAYAAAENKYSYLALKQMQSGDFETSNTMAAYQQMFSPAQGEMPWYNPMTGQTENRQVGYANQFQKMIGSAQHTAQNNIAAAPNDIYRWYSNNSGQPLPQAQPTQQSQVPTVNSQIPSVPVVPR